jgi:hypothetical protein
MCNDTPVTPDVACTPWPTPLPWPNGAHDHGLLLTLWHGGLRAVSQRIITKQGGFLCSGLSPTITRTALSSLSGLYPRIFILGIALNASHCHGAAQKHVTLFIPAQPILNLVWLTHGLHQVPVM